MTGITITLTTALALLGLAIAFFYMKKVTSVPLDLGLEEKDASRLKFIHGAIADGAMAFLKQEYKFLTIFMVCFAAIIIVLVDDAHTPDTRSIFRFDLTPTIAKIGSMHNLGRLAIAQEVFDERIVSAQQMPVR